jgi:imidazolonepropionase-like amidohydrolase
VSTLITGATVVDVFTATAQRADVLVSEGVITAIGTGLVGDETVDLSGHYLMPGLINMHNHFSLTLPGAEGDRIGALDAYGLALYMADAATKTVRAGVTTVRCVAEKDGADFALRSAIQGGTIVGPRILTAGRALVCTGGHGHEGSDTLECDGADGFARGVREQIKRGADVIKVMISGGIAGEHEQIATPQLRREEMAAVIEVAHSWGCKVTAHAGPASVIAEAVELGLDCVEHGYQLTPEVAAAMAAAGTALVPTLVVTRAGSFFDTLGVPAWMQQRSLDAGPAHIASYRMAQDAGVEILLGSDMPPYWPFEGTSAIVRELEYMNEFGLDAASALAAATIGPARWLGIDDSTGSVSVGKSADLIALTQNPLESVDALRSLDFVMAAGAIVRHDRAL